jgi:hypothetical protein
MARSFRFGRMDKGQAGELISRILLLSTIQNGASGRSNMKRLFLPFSVSKFLSDIGVHPADSPSAISFPDTLFSPLDDFLMNFVQFVPLFRKPLEVRNKKAPCTTKKLLLEGVRRACAFVTSNNFPGLDCILPIIGPNDQVGCIGVQVKALKGKPMINPEEIFEGMILTRCIPSRKQSGAQVTIEAGILNPLNILVQLSDSNSARKFQCELSGYECFHSDEPYVSVYKQLVNERECLFVHVFGVEAFKQVVPNKAIRSKLIDLIRWGTTLENVNRAIRYRESFRRPFILVTTTESLLKRLEHSSAFNTLIKSHIHKSHTLSLTIGGSSLPLVHVAG